MGIESQSLAYRSTKNMQSSVVYVISRCAIRMLLRTCYLSFYNTEAGRISDF